MKMGNGDVFVYHQRKNPRSKLSTQTNPHVTTNQRETSPRLNNMLRRRKEEEHFKLEELNTLFKCTSVYVHSLLQNFPSPKNQTNKYDSFLAIPLRCLGYHIIQKAKTKNGGSQKSAGVREKAVSDKLDRKNEKVEDD